MGRNNTHKKTRFGKPSGALYFRCLIPAHMALNTDFHYFYGRNSLAFFGTLLE